MTVLGVTFRYKGENHKMGASISAKKVVSSSNSTAVFHTPFTMASDNQEQLIEDGKFLPPEMIKILLDLQYQANDYINGARAIDTVD